MNKYLMMSAAALMATGGTTAPASAGTMTIGMSGYCDQFAFTSGVVYGIQHLYTGCGWTSQNDLYPGIVGKSRKFGQLAGFDKFITIDTSAAEGLGFGYVFQMPLKTGNAWCALVVSTYSGSGSIADCGTYYVTGQAAKKGVLAYLKPSTWSARDRSLATRRARKELHS